MPTTDILPTVRFQSGSVQRPLAAPLPRDTTDPRYRSCADHHTACVCREAEHAESIAELRSTLAEKERVIGALIDIVDPGKLTRRLERLLHVQERYHAHLRRGGAW